MPVNTFFRCHFIITVLYADGNNASPPPRYNALRGWRGMMYGLRTDRDDDDDDDDVISARSADSSAH